MWSICEHYVSCGLYVESCTILVVCWIIRDPSWYSMDYRVYMGSSMTVRSLRWLPLYLCSYKLVSSTIVIMFIVYFDYMLSIVGLSSCLCKSLYSPHSKVPWVGGRHYVSMVLIHCLSMDTLYIPGHVVDHGCDTPVESFVIHSLFVEQVEHGCEGRQALFLIFLSNVAYA